MWVHEVAVTQVQEAVLGLVEPHTICHGQFDQAQPGMWLLHIMPNIDLLNSAFLAMHLFSPDIELLSEKQSIRKTKKNSAKCCCFRLLHNSVSHQVCQEEKGVERFLMDCLANLEKW